MESAEELTITTIRAFYYPDRESMIRGNYSASSGKLVEKERSSVKKTKNDRRKA